MFTNLCCVVCDQVQHFLDKYKIINDFQFGFRKLHSTEQAILETVNDLRKSFDK